MRGWWRSWFSLLVGILILSGAGAGQAVAKSLVDGILEEVRDLERALSDKPKRKRDVRKASRKSDRYSVSFFDRVVSGLSPTREIVPNPTREPPGTIVVETNRKQLYLVLDDGMALRYAIGVGREGYTWRGITTVGRKAEWPEWRPPAAMLQRQPYLPRYMPGGINNPLGARALYLHAGGADTMFRIHGTNDPKTIGRNMSSGCIRLMNEDVVDLYNRVPVGARVVVR